MDTKITSQRELTLQEKIKLIKGLESTLTNIDINSKAKRQTRLKNFQKKYLCRN
jgi:hypothetical protein